MPTVVRFTLATDRTLHVLGVGTFFNGVLDVDANNLQLLERTRYLIDPYGVTEIGMLDSDTPFPTLPGEPVDPPPDPYPQYLTLDEVVTSTGLEAKYAHFSTVDGETLVIGTPDNEVAVGNNNDPIFEATEEFLGIVRLSTTDEALEGTDASTAVTPFGVKAAINAAGLVDAALLGEPDGVATLDNDGLLTLAQLPSIVLSDFLGAVATQAEMLALIGQRGDWATRTDLGVDFILIADDPTLLASWRQISSPGGVSSVAGRPGAVILVAADISNSTTIGRALMTAANQAAALSAAGAAAAVHSHDISTITIAGTPDGTKFLADDGTWSTPPGSSFTQVYNDVLWNDATSSWPARPNVPAGVPVKWYSTRYAAATPPVGDLENDIWYPHESRLP